jgi:prolyl-tRNA synthetase
MTGISGARGWEWVKKGVPVRVELGPRDIEKNTVFMARRDQPSSKKESMNREAFINEIPAILDNIQESIFNRADLYRKENTFEMDDKKQFYDLYQKASGFNNGAFIMAHWCGSDKCEKQLKDLSVTIRCIPATARQKTENVFIVVLPGQDGYCLQKHINYCL